jgi:hypothetical protein
MSEYSQCFPRLAFQALYILLTQRTQAVTAYRAGWLGRGQTRECSPKCTLVQYMLLHGEVQGILGRKEQKAASR